ncbi:adenylate/guanylate cyclase domain-containing protein, partial [Roseiarcus sp.]|uniref:adenylate/guanylate cyclase domain-containing protein n=1 Tax=Roseiarcus sp. TaxID=1969460 RepID=UPI003F95EC68
YDGFVAKFFGDGILAYFGFPRAHEDDAARAVHAALEIAEVVAGLQTCAPESLAVRVGVATGLVVVGDLVGQGSAQEQAVVGDTPNLAARLQALADAGGVVVAAATRRLLGDRSGCATSAGTPSRASPSRSKHGRRLACPKARAGSRQLIRCG